RRLAHDGECRREKDRLAAGWPRIQPVTIDALLARLSQIHEHVVRCRCGVAQPRARIDPEHVGMSQLQYASACETVSARLVGAFADQKLGKPECQTLLPDATLAFKENRAGKGAGVDHAAKPPADVFVARQRYDRHARNMARCVTV